MSAVAHSKMSDERVRAIPTWRFLLGRPELGAVAGTILVFGFFLTFAGDSGMFSAKGIITFLDVSAQVGILAAAVALLMIAGEFDLSIGSMIGFAGIVIAIPAVEWGWPLWSCILLAFLVALVIGFINGYLTISTGLPSFIVTLASMFILRGLTLALTRAATNRTVVSGIGDYAKDDWLAPIFSGYVLKDLFQCMGSLGWLQMRTDGTPLAPGIPMAVVWWMLLTLLGTWILMKTRFGNWIFASGGDPVAARNVGVPVTRVKILLFIGTAFAATLLAVIQVLEAGSADTLRGQLKEFEAIIAVVVGGTLLTGGYGSAIGAALGALIFGTVQMGIFFTGVDTDWFKVFMGAMVLIAVLFNTYVRRKVTYSR
ncbi:ABC transporter permease [Aestuariivirga sp. YIM B02566]|uniref:ABC transporter permease n=1 Tax=Taklimakanibacter albus TaxID=2800327 RepID=A0ACC5R8M4_9HYPH|nr:ABC transporter permease [Aestuariivirga sp. YIM B02566]MBK1868851.1 ABC transporter permease [Aestuariivirga sp. YIM B02566]